MTGRSLATLRRISVTSFWVDPEPYSALMISSLIEARSCERFALLGEACTDVELKKLYQGLWASEHGHYKTFIQLAEQIQPSESVGRRWGEMLDAEAGIIRNQAPGPRMHSGL